MNAALPAGSPTPSSAGSPPPSPDQLLAAARAAAAQAYAPYSGFPVGAAVLTEDGRVYTGCNVENAAFGSTLYAERGAVAAMALVGVRRIRSVAVVGLKAAPCFPCGACRQVLSEFGCRQVHVEDADGVRTLGFEEILPNGFGPGALS